MKITAIKQQIKRPNRYSVFIDEKYCCSFSDSNLLTLGLRLGQELNESELAKLKSHAIQDKAHSRALDMLSRRMRSEWELRDYLKRKDYPPEVIDYTLERLKKRGYIDDRAFASAWVENRRLLKSTSKRKLQMELKQKRIVDSLIDEVLAADATDEQMVLRQLIERKRLRYPDQLKLMRYLAGQGYQYDDIKAALATPEN